MGWVWGNAIPVHSQRVGNKSFARGAVHPHAPLANHCTDVAFFFKYLGNRNILVAKFQARPEAVGACFVVAPHPAVAGVHAGHQGGPGRRAYRTTRIMVGEEHAFLGEFVNIGRSDDFLTVAAQIAIPHVIGEDIYNIGGRWGRRGGTGK
jgi:hypothetical protein